MTVTVHVTVKEIGERDVLLTVEAWDEQGTIGHGTYRRIVVEAENILQKTRERVKTISSRRILN